MNYFKNDECSIDLFKQINDNSFFKSLIYVCNKNLKTSEKYQTKLPNKCDLEISECLIKNIKLLEEYKVKPPPYEELKNGNSYKLFVNKIDSLFNSFDFEDTGIESLKCLPEIFLNFKEDEIESNLSKISSDIEGYAFKNNLKPANIKNIWIMFKFLFYLNTISLDKKYLNDEKFWLVLLDYAKKNNKNFNKENESELSTNQNKLTTNGINSKEGNEEDVLMTIDIEDADTILIGNHDNKQSPNIDNNSNGLYPFKSLKQPRNKRLYEPDIRGNIFATYIPTSNDILNNTISHDDSNNNNSMEKSIGFNLENLTNNIKNMTNNLNNMQTFNAQIDSDNDSNNESSYASLFSDVEDKDDKDKEIKKSKLNERKKNENGKLELNINGNGKYDKNNKYNKLDKLDNYDKFDKNQKIKIFNIVKVYNKNSSFNNNDMINVSNGIVNEHDFISKKRKFSKFNRRFTSNVNHKNSFNNPNSISIGFNNNNNNNSNTNNTNNSSKINSNINSNNNSNIVMDIENNKLTKSKLFHTTETSDSITSSQSLFHFKKVKHENKIKLISEQGDDHPAPAVNPELNPNMKIFNNNSLGHLNSIINNLGNNGSNININNANDLSKNSFNGVINGNGNLNGNVNSSINGNINGIIHFKENKFEHIKKKSNKKDKDQLYSNSNKLNQVSSQLSQNSSNAICNDISSENSCIGEIIIDNSKFNNTITNNNNDNSMNNSNKQYQTNNNNFNKKSGNNSVNNNNLIQNNSTNSKNLYDTKPINVNNISTNKLKVQKMSKPNISIQNIQNNINLNINNTFYFHENSMMNISKFPEYFPETQELLIKYSLSQNYPYSKINKSEKGEKSDKSFDLESKLQTLNELLYNSANANVSYPEFTAMDVDDFLVKEKTIENVLLEQKLNKKSKYFI